MGGTQSMPLGMPITPENVYEFAERLRNFLLGKRFDLQGSMRKFFDGRRADQVLVRKEDNTLLLVIESGPTEWTSPVFNDLSLGTSGTIVRTGEMTILFICIGKDGKPFDWCWLSLR
jgi:hypothetical protein